MKVIKNKKIYTGEKTIPDGFIRFDRQIAEIGEMNNFAAQKDDMEEGTEGDILIPGFIDIHSHGGYGLDNMDASPEEIREMVHKMAKNEGITSYFCTTMTQTYEKIEAALKNIADAAKKTPIIQGVHVEGPFVSKEFKGAQDPAFIKKPDEKVLDRWNKISGGLIRIVTYAPEEAEIGFEEWCKSHSIVLSVGHSNATYEQLLKSGARHVTHLYNAQRGLKHREPGVTGFGLLTPGVKAELICDGIHIVPEMVKLAFEVRGCAGIELITDSMRAKGLPEGISELGGQKVYVKDHTARLEDGTIAGSVLSFIQAFQNVIKFTGASPEEAVKMSSVNQAEEFKLKQKGMLAKGKDADILVLNREYELQTTISMGTVIK
ncbi:N-acetylglucosamine-6-phosphate deacetylase [Clostridium sp. C105KSO13]|uniref:N-acetylglucosamine-6-phosphate deacetylase n=1 Tax=Clostridium sp. C105KSO13 TaxID=1776045 RepID=UPI00074062A3|nr:N-acetylglucosamine-6-phosphate deacetylase [Clostridium sp. C105KSO13]CUX38937.1 N-acetylglucosamine-6-phosphate deacetylase [Clostridium sp. C105KSO13]